MNMAVGLQEGEPGRIYDLGLNEEETVLPDNVMTV